MCPIISIIGLWCLDMHPMGPELDAEVLPLLRSVAAKQRLGRSNNIMIKYGCHIVL